MKVEITITQEEFSQVLKQYIQGKFVQRIEVDVNSFKTNLKEMKMTINLPEYTEPL